MSLRRSPQLTPASLAARRANAIKSTGPRSAAGKARSCLNALRHGRRARDLRAKLARMGDSEALFLLDWFHHHMLGFWRPRKERTWRYTVRLAARAWCFMNGLGMRPRAGETQEEAESKRDFLTYRYGDALGCPERPQGLRIGYKRGPAIKFLNSTPTGASTLCWAGCRNISTCPVRRVRQSASGVRGQKVKTRTRRLKPWILGPRQGVGRESMSLHTNSRRRLRVVPKTWYKRTWNVQKNQSLVRIPTILGAEARLRRRWGRSMT